ncbi:hypothetical protein ACUY2R_04125 [Corynebacterium mastitidis]
MSSPESVENSEELAQSPEEWSLDHPELGEIRVYVGSVRQLREVDPGFPAAEDSDDEEDSGDGSEAELKDTLGTMFPGIVVRREGVVLARLKSMNEKKISLVTGNAPKDGEYTTILLAPSRPRLRIETGFFDRWLKAAYVEDADGGTVDIIPPAGSRAEKYYRAMEKSSWKRLVYPLVGGMGKAGWAVAVLVAGPLIGKIIEWLLSLLPDYSLPSIPWPDVSLPSVSIPWPDISLPRIPWPDIPWPSITVPDWVKVIVEHEKIWFPILVGLVVGVVSLRRARKARRTRQRWRNEGGHLTPREALTEGPERDGADPGGEARRAEE